MIMIMKLKGKEEKEQWKRVSGQSWVPTDGLPEANISDPGQPWIRDSWSLNPEGMSILLSHFFAHKSG